MGTVLAASACTPARKKVTTDVVRQIRFEGNEGLFSGENDLQLRSAIQQSASPALTFLWPFTYFLRPRTLDEATLEADARRIEVWFAHRGKFDAHFDGWQVRRVRPRRGGRAGVVDLVGHVTPGPASTYRTIALQGVEDRVAPRTVVRGALRETGAAYGVAEGEVFGLEGVQAVREAMVAQLQRNGYAYASVEVSVQAFPDEGAVDVTYRIEPGIPAVFGPVTVEGLGGDSTLDEWYVTSSLDFDHLGAEGVDDPDNFDLEPLERSQQSIYDTRLFSLVDIQPDLSDPTREAVPITVSVTEAQTRRLRVGAGLDFDYFTLNPGLRAQYDDVRFAGTGLRVDAEAGVGAIVGVVTEDEGRAQAFLTGLAALRADYPWLADKRMGIAAGVQVERDAKFGSVPYWEVSTDLKIRRTFEPRERKDGKPPVLPGTFTLSAGPSFEYLTLAGDPPDGVRQLVFGEVDRTFSRLLAADVQLTYDSRGKRREDLLDPRDASYAALSLRQTMPLGPADGEGSQDFLYTKLEAEGRIWRSFGPRRGANPRPLVFAGRLRAMGILPWTFTPYGDNVAWNDRAFLGGANSVRGFRTQQLGPWDCVCSYEGGRPYPQHNQGQAYELDYTYLPRGGVLGVEGTAEVRVDLPYDLKGAVFADVGVLATQWSAFETRTADGDQPAWTPMDVFQDVFRYGAGVGVRYSSPIGPIRLDLGLRPLFREDLPPGSREADARRPAGDFNSYIDCNPIDRAARGYDLATGGLRVRRDIGDGVYDALPLAINIYLAIGEAF